MANELTWTDQEDTDESELAVTLSSPAPGVTLCKVVGEVDMATSSRLHRQLQHATDGAQHLLIDLSAVTFCAAAGVGVLLQAREAQDEDHALVLVASSRPVLRVLEACDLDRHFRRRTTLAGAAAACTDTSVWEPVQVLDVTVVAGLNPMVT